MEDLRLKLLDNIADQAFVYEKKYDAAITKDTEEVYINAIHNLMYLANFLNTSNFFDEGDDNGLDTHFSIVHDDLVSFVETVDTNHPMYALGHTRFISVAHLDNDKFKILPFQAYSNIDGMNGHMQIVQILPTDVSLPEIAFKDQECDDHPLIGKFKMGLAIALHHMHQHCN